MRHLRRRGAGALFGRLQQFDAIGVDDDVLARREERHDDGEERDRHPVMRRVCRTQRQDGERQGDLDGQRPTPPSP
jgi:hypothetical protein